MSQSPQALTLAMMSKIDDIKESISDGDYLELCNLLKKLNDTVKTYKPTTITNDENESDYESVDEGQEEETFDDKLDNILYSVDIMDHNMNYTITRDEMLERFNRLIIELEDTEASTEQNKNWFRCPCDCDVCINAISEHIRTPEHNNNFQLPQQ